MSRPELMKPDGSFNIDRLGLRPSYSRDLYHFLLTSSWPVFLSLLIGVYLLSNLVFALCYSLDPAGISHTGSFADIFFFAVQTMSTVGYGAMAPQSIFAHLVMVVQLVYGFVLTAISTGLVFAKFSRVRARVLFSSQALIHRFQDVTVLTFRAANQRSSQILDATVRLTLARDEIGIDGQRMRRFYTLRLLRDSSPLFALVWNVYHVIDEQSPLWGLDAADLQGNFSTLLITFSGMDDALSQPMHTRHAYNPSEILFKRRFQDIIGQNPDGRRYVNYLLFHDTLVLEQPLAWEAAASEAVAEEENAEKHRTGIEENSQEVGQKGPEH
ncbi:MAG: ion channel [Candidatus Sericytochromatia bacterium]